MKWINVQFSYRLMSTVITTGPGQTSNARWGLSSSVTLHGGPAGVFTREGQAIT